MSDRNKYLLQPNANNLYFRFKGKSTPLPNDRDSAAFRAAYDAALRAAKLGAAKAKTAHVKGTRINGATAVLPATLGAAIDVYMDSAAFDKLEASTRRQYDYTLKELRERLGSGKLADVDTDFVDIYTDRLAKERGTSVADRHMRMLSKIWKVCRKFPQFGLKGKPNPGMEAEKHYTVQNRYRPWSQAVQDAFMAGAPDHLKLAKLLLHFTAQRGSDCVKMKWSDYDGNGIAVRQRKTDGEADALPDYYLCTKRLKKALDAAPRTAETILVSAHGKSYANADGLSHAIKNELVRLGLAKHGVRSVVMHGLRKTAASQVGSLPGVGTSGVMSITGHRSDSEAAYYAKDADKRRTNANVIEQWDAELDRQDREAAAQRRRSRLRAVG